MHDLISIAPIYEVWHVQVYVIGSTAQLGQWKVQDGLKLNYAGYSVWQADALMQKGDFPIKYPFEVFPSNSWMFHELFGNCYILFPPPSHACLCLSSLMVVYV